MIAVKKYRWLFLILIWLGAAYLTHLNSYKIRVVLSNRSEREVLRLDKGFWERNSDNIADVLNQEKSLYQEIESLKIGQVALRDQIDAIIKDAGLNTLIFETDEKGAQGALIPFRISFKGTSRAGMGVLKRIQGEFPFLFFQKISILPENQTDEVKFDIVVNYSYRIVTRLG